MNTVFDPAAKAGAPGNPSSATRALNTLGLDLLARGTEPGANALLSPYSIQSALAPALPAQTATRVVPTMKRQGYFGYAGVTASAS